jgi:HlyD family secretion protein
MTALRGRWLIGRLVTLAVVALLIFASLRAHLWTRTPTLPPDRALFETAEERSLQAAVTFSAQVEPRDVMYVNALEGGQVERALVHYGDLVRKGQILLQLSNPDLAKEVANTELSLSQQIGSLHTNELNLEDERAANEQQLAELDQSMARLKRIAERQKVYFAKGIASAEERDNAVSELEHATTMRELARQHNERLAALRNERAPELKASLAKFLRDEQDNRSKLADLAIRAPESGRFESGTARVGPGDNFRIGETIGRGQHIGDLTLNSGVRLAAEVADTQFPLLQVGQPAEVQVTKSTVAVTLERIYPRATDGKVRIELAFAGPTPAGLLIGQTLQGQLPVPTGAPALVLPANSLIGAKGLEYVFVLAQDHQSARRREIKVGRRTADQVEVLSGLRAGDTVVAAGLTGIDHLENYPTIRLSGSESDPHAG